MDRADLGYQGNLYRFSSQPMELDAGAPGQVPEGFRVQWGLVSPDASTVNQKGALGGSILGVARAHHFSPDGPRDRETDWIRWWTIGLLEILEVKHVSIFSLDDPRLHLEHRVMEPARFVGRTFPTWASGRLRAYASQ